MQRSRAALAAALLAAVLGSLAPAHSSQDNPQPMKNANLKGLHDFDLRVGDWTAHHRRLKERLAGSHEWQEFDGTCSFYPLLGGWANVDENVFKMPGGDYRGVSLRAYDPKTGQWAIWWLDGRNPFGELTRRSRGISRTASEPFTPTTSCAENRSACASPGQKSPTTPPTGNSPSPPTAARPGSSTGSPTSAACRGRTAVGRAFHRSLPNPGRRRPRRVRDFFFGR